MPYKNIHWIKLEIRLLNDPRFFLMSEKSQLLYIKILLGLASYGGKIPINGGKTEENGGKTTPLLAHTLRLDWTQQEIEKALNEIRKNFPKVLINNGFITIKEFKSKHNWVTPKEIPGSSQGVPKEVIDKIIDKIIDKKRIDKTNPAVVSYCYKRYGRAVKELYALSGCDVPTVLKAIDWVADWCSSKCLNWEIETVLKHFLNGKACNFATNNAINPKDKAWLDEVNSL